MRKKKTDCLTGPGIRDERFGLLQENWQQRLRRTRRKGKKRAPKVKTALTGLQTPKMGRRERPSRILHGGAIASGEEGRGPLMASETNEKKQRSRKEKEDKEKRSFKS